MRRCSRVSARSPSATARGSPRKRRPRCRGRRGGSGQARGDAETTPEQHRRASMMMSHRGVDKSSQVGTGASTARRGGDGTVRRSGPAGVSPSRPVACVARTSPIVAAALLIAAAPPRQAAESCEAAPRRRRQKQGRQWRGLPGRRGRRGGDQRLRAGAVRALQQVAKAPRSVRARAPSEHERQVMHRRARRFVCGSRCPGRFEVDQIWDNDVVPVYLTLSLSVRRVWCARVGLRRTRHTRRDQDWDVAASRK